MLRSAFGVRDTALSWFASYLSGRTQQVSVDGTLSTKFDLDCGVPQGSCRGPLLFFVYASKIFEIVDKHNLEIHAMWTIANSIYPYVLITMLIKRTPWLVSKVVLKTFVSE